LFCHELTYCPAHLSHRFACATDQASPGNSLDAFQPLQNNAGPWRSFPVSSQ
jgi:hypothetical protein